ncbi:hypothetical protein RHSIM_RhsimUnG0101300 [Rhododendron simsii]|uniref:Uncharacterized protein n=1 Tax=Rhododendron simsii TaxID=118357 RepID=A0A834L2L5_RHOSS|nr:hypothetical protein RHSIM_RhsimUnG0101300 [Rhododendron simsii]
MAFVMDYYYGTKGVLSSDYIFLVEFGLFDMKEIKHFMEEHAKSTPISWSTTYSLTDPTDTKHHLKDVLVCQPFHMELNFFNRENQVIQYPVKEFYLEGANVMAYNLCYGVDNIYKKLYNLSVFFLSYFQNYYLLSSRYEFASKTSVFGFQILGHVEFKSKHLLYRNKQHLFLVVYEFSGATNEVVLYWENTDAQSAESEESTIKGRDVAVFGPNENHFVILDEDKTGLDLYVLPGGDSQEVGKKNVLDEQSQATDLNVGAVKGPLQFFFEMEVDRIFSTPIDWPGLKLVKGYHLSNSDGHYITTKDEGRKAIKLKVNEIVLQDLIQHRHPILLL